MPGPVRARDRVRHQCEAHVAPKIHSHAVFGRIDHIGVAVADLESAIELHTRAYGMPLVHRETIAEQGVEAVLLDVGESHVELLKPSERGLARRALPGEEGAGAASRRLPGGDVEAALARRARRGCG